MFGRFFSFQSTPAYEAKSSDAAVETSAADDAIENSAKDDDNLTAEDSPSVAPEKDSPSDDGADAVDEAAAVTPTLIRRLAAALADSWPKLAPLLGFSQDEIGYLETADSVPVTQATKMLTVWTVSIDIDLRTNCVTHQMCQHNSLLNGNSRLK